MSNPWSRCRKVRLKRKTQLQYCDLISNVPKACTKFRKCTVPQRATLGRTVQLVIRSAAASLDQDRDPSNSAREWEQLIAWRNVGRSEAHSKYEEIKPCDEILLPTHHRDRRPTPVLTHPHGHGFIRHRAASPSSEGRLLSKRRKFNVKRRKRNIKAKEEEYQSEGQ